MSRVFEALSKASHERNLQPENATKDPEPHIHEALSSDDEFSSTPAPSFGHNGVDHSISLASRTSPVAVASWRERIEELFFGWDLRRYSALTIVSLEEESLASVYYIILSELI